METANPYTPPENLMRDATPKRGRSIGKRLFLGFCLGASIPALLGTYGLYQFNVYVASLPPGEFACGNGALGPVMLLMFGVPLLGVVGAAVAAVIP